MHIGGLDRDKETPKEEIEREFSRFQESGDVNVWVARKPPGFAFVTFTDARDAEDACKELNGKSLFGQENVLKKRNFNFGWGVESPRIPIRGDRFTPAWAMRSKLHSSNLC